MTRISLKFVKAHVYDLGFLLTTLTTYNKKKIFEVVSTPIISKLRSDISSSHIPLGRNQQQLRSTSIESGWFVHKCVPEEDMIYIYYKNDDSLFTRKSNLKCGQGNFVQRLNSKEAY